MQQSITANSSPNVQRSKASRTPTESIICHWLQATLTHWTAGFNTTLISYGFLRFFFLITFFHIFVSIFVLYKAYYCTLVQSQLVALPDLFWLYFHPYNVGQDRAMYGLFHIFSICKLSIRYIQCFSRISWDSSFRFSFQTHPLSFFFYF